MKTNLKFRTQKQQDRYENLVKDGIPRYIRCYDNNGETADRYTVVFTGRYRKHNEECIYLGMSANPFHPQGVGQHGWSPTLIDKPEYSHLGKKIQYNDLPEKCKECVMHDYLYLWGLTNEENELIN